MQLPIPFRRIHRLVPLAALLAAPLSAQTPVASEGFDYTEGRALMGKDGGSGWLAAWRGNPAAKRHATVTGGLAFAKGGETLPELGSGAVVLDGDAAGGNVAIIRRPMKGFASESFWISCLVRLDGRSDGAVVFRILDDLGQSNRIYIGGDGSGRFDASLVSEEGPNQIDFATGLPTDEPLLLVLHLDRSEGEHGTVSAWINPDIGPDWPRNALGGASHQPNGLTGAINNLGWIGGSGGSHTYDALRLGPSFKAVTARP